MARIECLLVLSYFLIFSCTQMKETEAFAAGLRYGKRTLASKYEESDPNVQREQEIGKSFHFMFYKTCRLVTKT